jgi:hypothetical protein
MHIALKTLYDRNFTVQGVRKIWDGKLHHTPTVSDLGALK